MTIPLTSLAIFVKLVKIELGTFAAELGERILAAAASPGEKFDRKSVALAHATIAAPYPRSRLMDFSRFAIWKLVKMAIDGK